MFSTYAITQDSGVWFGKRSQIMDSEEDFYSYNSCLFMVILLVTLKYIDNIKVYIKTKQKIIM